MTLEECLEAHKKSKTVIGESTTIYTKQGKGVSREVSFVPKKDSSKKKADGVTTGDHSSSKRKDHERRGTIKELGFKIPFLKGRRS